jgi:hypothetical protein
MNATAAPTAARPATRLAVPLVLALRLDAVVTGANGLAYLAAAGPLSDLLGLDAGFLRGIGLFLLAFTAFVWRVSARTTPRPGAVRAVIAVNAAWVVGSLALAALALGSPSTAGTVWAVVQAVVVGAFAELQILALRRRP